MSGFKKFLLRGNLVELAVAFIMATVFAAVVKAFVAIILDIIGKAGGSPNWSNYKPDGIEVGSFVTALVTFLIVAAVVYYFVVVPYTKAKDKFFPDEEEAEAEELTTLKEILATLQSQNRD